MKPSLTRRQFTAGAAATFASIAIIKAPAKAAQFQYKYGNDQTISSPVNVRAIEMWKAIETETGGKLTVQTFPDSQLGGDSQMVTQLRSGALQFLTEPGAILGSVVPNAQLDSVGFSFKDTKQAFAAMDGDLGAWVRKEIMAKGMYALPYPFDNGFRQITANKPIQKAADIDGYKMRVPTSPIFLDLFKTLGASPTPINVSELYTSLQTHIVEGEENALVNINQSKLYEVQKTLNFSNHAWSCWWMLVNNDAWKRARARHPGRRHPQHAEVLADAAPRSRAADGVAHRQAAAPGHDRLPGRRPVVQSAPRPVLRQVEGRVRRHRVGAAREVHRHARLAL